MHSHLHWIRYESIIFCSYSLGVIYSMWWLISIIVVLTILLLHNIYRAWRSRAEFSTNYMAGLWVGDPDFCEQSGSGGILLYIDDPSDRVDETGYCVGRAGEKKTSAIMIMHSAHEVVLDKCFTLERQSDGLIDCWPNFGHVRNFWYKLSDLDSEIPIDEFMCDYMRIEMDPCAGTMCWYGEDDTLYLKAHKNSLAASEADLGWSAIQSTIDSVQIEDRDDGIAAARAISNSDLFDDEDDHIPTDHDESIGIEDDDPDDLDDASNTIKLQSDMRQAMRQRMA